MVVLAIGAVCVTVNLRTRTKAQVAALQFSAMESDVQSLRDLNQSLRIEVEKLKSDPRTIELAARSRLNMVRANEYVVPVE
jgi:cell division protein FtsB